MPDVLVRNVREDAARSLKEVARDERRSASGEAAMALKQFARCQRERFERRQRTIEVAAEWRARLAGRDLGEDSTSITRHDRDTDHGRA